MNSHCLENWTKLTDLKHLLNDERGLAGVIYDHFDSLSLQSDETTLYADDILVFYQDCFDRFMKFCRSAHIKVKAVQFKDDIANFILNITRSFIEEVFIANEFGYYEEIINQKDNIDAFLAEILKAVYILCEKNRLYFSDIYPYIYGIELDFIDTCKYLGYTKHPIIYIPASALFEIPEYYSDYIERNPYEKKMVVFTPRMSSVIDVEETIGSYFDEIMTIINPDDVDEFYRFCIKYDDILLSDFSEMICNYYEQDSYIGDSIELANRLITYYPYLASILPENMLNEAISDYKNYELIDINMTMFMQYFVQILQYIDDMQKYECVYCELNYCYQEIIKIACRSFDGVALNDIAYYLEEISIPNEYIENQILCEVEDMLSVMHQGDFSNVQQIGKLLQNKVVYDYILAVKPDIISAYSAI